MLLVVGCRVGDGSERSNVVEVAARVVVRQHALFAFGNRRRASSSAGERRTLQRYCGKVFDGVPAALGRAVLFHRHRRVTIRGFWTDFCRHDSDICRHTINDEFRRCRRRIVAVRTVRVDGCSGSSFAFDVPGLFRLVYIRPGSAALARRTGRFRRRFLERG